MSRYWRFAKVKGASLILATAEEMWSHDAKISRWCRRMKNRLDSKGVLR